MQCWMLRSPKICSQQAGHWWPTGGNVLVLVWRPENQKNQWYKFQFKARSFKNQEELMFQLKFKEGRKKNKQTDVPIQGSQVEAMTFYSRRSHPFCSIKAFNCLHKACLH